MRREQIRSNDPEGLRRRVLDVAAAAFQADGYHSTSTHDIMRAAQVTGGALHHHFPTKKLLGLAVIKERVAPAVEQTWIAPIRSAPSVIGGILSTFEAIATSVDERGKVLGCPLNNLVIELSLADKEFQAALAEILDAWRKAIAQKVSSEKGVVTRSINPDDLATFVVASFSGAMAMAKARQSSEPLRSCARQLAILLDAQITTGTDHIR